MNFSHPWILHFLWSVPLTILLFLTSGRKRTQAMERFAEPHLLKYLTGSRGKGRGVLRSASLVTVLGLMVLAWAGPRWGSHYEEVQQKGVDIVIALDISRSMLVADVEPSRLVRAKREILDLIQVIRGDRLGLVAFAGAAFTQCPLTLDYGAVIMFLTALTPDMAPAPGTDLGAAIEAGIGVFEASAETDKVLLLITDGEDNEKRGLEAARKAARKGIRIFVFGVGDPSGGPIPAIDGTGGFQKDGEGRPILSKLNEEGLKGIASLTGGSYARSVAGDLDLDLLYFDGIRKKTRATDLKAGKIKVYEERFPLFVMAAFFLLLLEGLVREGGRRGTIGGKPEPGTGDRGRGTPTNDPARQERVAPRMGLTVLFLAAAMALPPVRAGAEDPDELYREGRFEEARKIYAQSELDHPRDLRHRYNRGCADYQAGDYQGAMMAFSSVLRRAEERDLRFRAAYNLGNAAFRSGDAASAAEYYRQALRIKPDQEDARYNLEIALRKLEEESQKTGRREDADPDQGGGKGAPKDREGGDSRSETGADTASREKGEPEGPLNPGEGGPPPDRVRNAGKGERTVPPSSASPMDRKKAEALLDNVTEDRSQFLRLQHPELGQGGAGSGKDW